jgi:hypothetical protein
MPSAKSEATNRRATDRTTETMTRGIGALPINGTTGLPAHPLAIKQAPLSTTLSGITKNG